MKNYLRKNKLVLLIYGIFSIATYGFLSLIFTSYSWITDIALSKDFEQGKIVTIQVILLILGMLIFLILMSFIKRHILYKVSKSLRKDMVSKLFDLDYSRFYDKERVYYLSMIINDVDTLENDYYTNLINIIEDAIQLLVLLIFIAMIDIKFVFIIFLLNIPSVIQPFLLRKKIRIAGLNSSNAMVQYNDKTNEYVYGMEEIITTNNQDVFQYKFTEDASILERVRYKEKHLSLINFILIITATYIIKIGSLLFLVNEAISGLLSVALVTALFGYANNIGNPISSILGYYNKINATKNVKEKVDIFLSGENNSGNLLKDIESIDRIIVKDLSFSYKDYQILNKINYTFNKGSKYAIFGDSGSGKSTLIKILMGFYDEYEGGVFFDNLELTTIKNSSLWQEIAYIKQDVFIMSGSLRDNITLFSNEYSEEEINRSIEYAGINELVESLPNGIDTYIEEGGKNFSGGEKQRISLARALISDRNILLLDESFSALDNKNAVEIESNILSLNKTIIMISHRPNDNLYKYDNIIVLKDGEIVENGSYEELLNDKTYFYSLIKNDKGGKDDEEEKQYSHEVTLP